VVGGAKQGGKRGRIDGNLTLTERKFINMEKRHTERGRERETPTQNKVELEII